MTNLGDGQRAPEFALKALDGKEHSLESLRKRGPVVVAFFKISCPVCQFTFPFLERLHEQFAGDGTTVVGVSQDNPRDTQRFNQEYGVKFLTLIDEHPYPASSAYGLTSVPTIFLIEPNGLIKVSCMGFSKGDLEFIATELAGQKDIQAAPLFRAHEIVPAHKPG